MKKVKVRSKKLNLPWINERLWTLMKQRDVALKMALKTKTKYDKRVFTTLRNKVIKDSEMLRPHFSSMPLLRLREMQNIFGIIKKKKK